MTSAACWSSAWQLLYLRRGYDTKPAYWQNNCSKVQSAVHVQVINGAGAATGADRYRTQSMLITPFPDGTPCCICVDMAPSAVDVQMLVMQPSAPVAVPVIA